MARKHGALVRGEKRLRVNGPPDLGLDDEGSALGRHLPIASVGALVRGDLPGVGAVFTTLLVCGLAAWMFDRSAR